MDVIFGGLMCLLIAWLGYLAGADNKKHKYEKIVEEDRKYYMDMLKREYRRGYNDGLLAKVTPNELRKVLGLPPMEESTYVHTEQRLEDTEETT